MTDNTKGESHPAPSAGSSGAPAPTAPATHNLRGSEAAVGRFVHTDQFDVMGPGKMTAGGEGGFTSSFRLESKIVSELQVIATDKVKLTYLMDKTTHETEVAGEKSIEAERGELDGVSLIGTRTSGSWKFALEVGEPTEKQRKKIDLLGRIFSVNGEDLYPDRAVAVGESWTASPMAVRALLGADVLSAQGSITLSLRSVEPCGSEQCARIETVVDVTAKTLTDENDELEIQVGGTGRTLRDLSRHVDIETSFDGLAVMEGGALEMRGPLVGKSTTVVK